MAIHFLIRPNRKKAPRINVLRYLKDNEEKKQHKNIGTLPDDLDRAIDAFKSELDEYEQYQLENYVKNMQFNANHFKANAGETERELIYFAPIFHEALFTLWKLAKENQLDFNPHEVMMTAILNKAKAVERSLNEKLKEPVNVLEKIGVDIHRFEKKEINKRLHTGSQQLFQALLESGQSLTLLSDRFNALAENYQKKPALKPQHIKEYADSPKRLPLWYLAIAIDMLLELGKNPLDIISIKQTIDAWLTVRKNQLFPEEATLLFMGKFKPTMSSEKVDGIIKERYKNKNALSAN